MITHYKNFVIREATYMQDYGAWLSSKKYVYFHKNMEDDPERLAHTYGYADTIYKCQEDIDDLYDLHEDLLT